VSDQLHIPEDSFIVAQGVSQGLPDIWLVNSALDGLRPKQAFPWHLSIIVDCEETSDAGLPTKEENEVLADVGDAFDESLLRAGNAVRLARITWNRTRQYLYRVRDPERANAYLKALIDDKSHLREFDFRMESDPEWLLAKPYLTLNQRQVD
jgi:hypothetical protein